MNCFHQATQDGYTLFPLSCAAAATASVATSSVIQHSNILVENLMIPKNFQLLPSNTKESDL